MGEFCFIKPDWLIERAREDRDGLEFVIEALESRNSYPGDIALKEAFREQSLTKAASRKTRQDYLNDIIFSWSKIKLPADASPDQRAEVMKKHLDNKNTKLRFIFSSWPRPEGVRYKDLTPANSIVAKMTPNGNQFWAATLFDFYPVRRLHDQPELHSISTSSKLAKWAKDNGEMDGQIKVALEWAEDEKDPEVIAPYDIRVIIQAREESIRQHIIDSQMDEVQKEQEGELQSDRWTLPEQWPPKSVFEPEAYPRGWSTEAFSDDMLYGPRAIPVLQHYIPQYRLPEKLVVHDPSNVLDCRRRPETSESGYPADAGPKVIYRLKSSEKYADRRKEDKEKEAEEDAQAKKTLESFLANPHSSLERPNGFELVDLKEPGWTKPAVFVVFPFRPSFRRPEEAHLYLSPNHLMGLGSHSRVYNAELVVPRSWLIDEAMCVECVKNDVKKLLEEEDGPHGERRLKKWDEKTGMVVRQEIRKRPVHTMKDWDNVGTVTYVVKDGVSMDVMAYEGPYRVVHTRIVYQNLERGPLCVHLSKGKAHPHPLATKVCLAAKLSNDNVSDLRMLEREADNYQGFPKHFFEHWSGYNVCWPMHEPVPVGPLVPQFYGYYVPENVCGTYQSPILLVEQCGKQITARELSVDDRNECISLGLRMNAAGWVHGSIWERNILRQPGPLDKSQFWRKMNKKLRDGYGVDWSFRLIDFGRSYHINDLIRTSEAHSTILEETRKLKGWWQSGTVHWN